MRILNKIAEFFARQELSLNMMCTNMSYVEYKEELELINLTYGE